MRKVMLTVIALLFALLLASPARAQHTPRGTAMDISKAEIEATVQKTASAPVSDQQIRVMDINGDYNVGVGVVHRAKTAGRDVGGGVEHSQIVYLDDFAQNIEAARALGWSTIHVSDMDAAIAEIDTFL